MKKVAFVFSQTDFRDDNYGGYTLPRALKEDVIQEELADTLAAGEFKAASLSYKFPKSEFDLEFVESLLSTNGEIVGETEEYFDVDWTIYHEL